MQPITKVPSMSDDEDDLESLRLAALQSLKRPVPQVTQKLPTTKKHIGAKPFHRRGRGFHNGRHHRNGLFNNRIRSSNLIAVPTIETENTNATLEDLNCNKKPTDQLPKLILPQDRYFNIAKVANEKLSETSSKFDRYNDSDRTDSESESENEHKTDSPKKLERTNSLEILMQELENEIHGDSKVLGEEKAEAKPKSKRQKSKVEEIEVKPTASDSETSNVNEAKPKDAEGPPRKKSRSPANLPDVSNPKKANIVETTPVYPVSSNISAGIPFQPLPYRNFNVPVYNYSNSQPPTQLFPSQCYERPLSPLSIKTDILNTITAPLSPRSAAFVLQNREIIERRKKSPRRSYSRSPTPEFRRSVSPRYRRSKSRSPNTNRSRKTSPNLRRHSPNSQFHNRRSPNNRYRISSPADVSSPKRIRPSPHSSCRNKPVETQVSTNKTDEIKDNVRKRSRSISLSLSPSPEPFKYGDSLSNKDDPVLEARKLKFKKSGVLASEGIIRLKSKSNEEQNSPLNIESPEDLKDNDSKTECLVEEIFLGGDEGEVDFNIKLDDIFSDEESDSENEGRFKTGRRNAARAVAILPYTQLLNGSKKSEVVGKERRRKDHEKKYSDRKTKSDFKSENKIRSYSDESRKEAVKFDRKPSKSLKESKYESKRTASISSSIENKKIEIKIRNPLKYDVEANKKEKKGTVRKVEVTSDSLIEKKDTEFEDIHPDIITNNDEETAEDLVNKNDAGGDLRAQLSRKRAERQNKAPPVEGVPARLLQNALQSAVFKKSKKTKSKKKDKEAAPIDAKLPIRLRLGIPGSLEVFKETKSQKISRKRNKNRGSYEQV